MSELPLEKVLDSNLYFLSSCDTASPAWKTFTDSIPEHDNVVDWAYEFYLRQRSSRRRKPESNFGIFGYNYNRESRCIHIHTGRDASGWGTFNRERMDIRKAELRNMFRYIKAHHSDAEIVRGRSWLYNIKAYQRLFPEEYAKAAKPAGYVLDDYALWGQFIGRDETVREPMASHFVECLARQQTVESCLRCFPHQMLNTMCPIDAFYDFYGV